LNLGPQAHRKDDIGSTRDAYQRALQIDPEQLNALHLLGTAAASTGRTGLHVCLLINFGRPKNGVKQVILNF